MAHVGPVPDPSLGGVCALNLVVLGAGGMLPVGLGVTWRRVWGVGIHGFLVIGKRVGSEVASVVLLDWRPGSRGCVPDVVPVIVVVVLVVQPRRACCGLIVHASVFFRGILGYRLLSEFSRSRAELSW
jgi:hypothetical protein